MSPAKPSADSVDLGMPAGLPGMRPALAQAADENFPVALRILSRDVRSDLLAVYGFARLTDDIGDEYDGDRLAALDWLEGDLHACLTGSAQHPLVARLGPVITRRRLEIDLFKDLIDANRRDQRQRRYETFEELLDYCRQSANPIGRLVLAIFGVTDPAALAFSDDVCSGLQVVEHLQDVREDLHAGRVYLPGEDLIAFGCTESDLARPTANLPVRCLVIDLCGRSRTLLTSGEPLVEILRGQSRLAIAGFVAGGRATLDAIESVDGDVLAHRCRPARHRVITHAAALLRPHWMRRRRR